MSANLDADGQPYAIGFNRARNVDKAAYVLRGIIDGVNANGFLTDAEILYLDAWMRSQENLRLESDSLDLFQAVKHVLEDKKITQDERADLHQLIQDILDFGGREKTSEESRINEFLGLVKGVCADGVVDRSEIGRVEAWISANKEIAELFPIKPVYERISDAMADSIITDDELDDLSKLLAEIAGDRFTETGDVDGSIGKVFCDNLDQIAFEDQIFCFTGKFLSGTRKQCQEEARSRGAHVKSDVSSKVDVLVIGSVTSRDWRFQNFGRKIERAMGLRNNNGTPIILSEESWITFLEK